MPVSYRYVYPDIGHCRRVPLITTVSFSHFHFFPSMKETHFMPTAVENQCSGNYFKSTSHKEWYIGWCASTRIQDTKKQMDVKLEQHNRPKRQATKRQAKYKPQNGVPEYLYSTSTNNMNAIPRKRKPGA